MVLIEKEVTRIDKNAEKITKIYLTYYNLLIFISLSNTVKNLYERIHSIKSLQIF